MHTDQDTFDRNLLNKLISNAKSCIRYFGRDSLAYNLIATLNKLPKDEEGKVQFIRSYQPWYLLLAIKWALQGRDRNGEAAARLDDVDLVMGKMSLINDRLPIPSEYECVELYFKNLAYQQFWLQDIVNFDRFLRQRLLFMVLGDRSNFSHEFLRATGISLDGYLELSYMLMSHFIRKVEEPLFGTKYFSSVVDEYLVNMVPQYLDLISADFDKMSILINKIGFKYRNPLYEIYEQSPLKQYPLWRNGARYRPVFLPLLFHCLQDFVYDTLKRQNPQGFMDVFGPVFERYIEMGLDYLGCSYLCESDLKSYLTGSKLVDFLVIDGDCKVFIDAKGVEMSPLGKVAIDVSTVKRQLKNSVLKGIRQGCEAAKNIDKLRHLCGVTLRRGNNYLLIVTYDDLYLGTGSSFLEAYAPEELVNFRNEYGLNATIPPENIYFMSVDHFDWLVRYSITTNIPISDILKKAVHDDQNPSKSKYIFSMHLQDAPGRLMRLPYLDDQNSEMLKSMKGKLLE